MSCDFEGAAPGRVVGWEPGPKELQRRSCNPGVLLNFLANSVKFLTIIARRGAILLNFLNKSAKELQLDLFLSRFSPLYYFLYIFPFNYTKNLEKSPYFTTLEKKPCENLDIRAGRGTIFVKNFNYLRSCIRAGKLRF